MVVDVDADEAWCGVVLADRGRRLVVRGRDGTRTVEPRRVHRLAPLVASATTPGRVTGLLDALDDAVDRAYPRLAELWARADDADEWPSVADLVADLGGSTDVTEAAIGLIALRGCPWFVAEDACVRPTTREERDERLHTAAEDEAVRARLGAFVAAVRRRGADPAAPRVDDADLLRVLETCAWRGDPLDASRRDRVVDGAASAAGVAEGPRWRRAFDTLVAIGHWGRDHAVEIDRLGLDRGWPVARTEPPSMEHLPLVDDVVSIDGPGTDDIDDAFAARTLGDGGVAFTVVIAHPPAMIGLDDPLAVEAARRGTSVYLPTGTFGMLPPAWGEDALSLRAGEQRPALEICWTGDPDGTIRAGGAVRLVQTRVKANLVWADVFAGTEGARWDSALAWVDAFRAWRRSRGARFSELPRARVRVASDGAMTLARSERSGPEHRLVAEVMVAANAVVGRWCADRGVVVPWRAQPMPDDAARIDAWLAGEDSLVGGWRAARAMPAASTVFEPAPHHGLGVDAYVQVTSPVRRFTDWLAHASIRAALLGEPPIDDLADRVAAAEVAARASARAMRRTHHYWRLRWLEAQGDVPMDAAVLRGAAAGRRVEVLLVDPLVSMRVTATRALAPGDRVRVQITAVDPRAGRLKGQLVDATG